MKQLKRNIAITFGVVVVVFSIPVILSIWGIIDWEIGARSAQTLAVIFVSLWIASVITNNLSKDK